jgi:hypothetical protein
MALFSAIRRIFAWSTRPSSWKARRSNSIFVPVTEPNSQE